MPTENKKSTVYDEIIEDLYFQPDALTAQKTSKHIVNLNDEVMAGRVSTEAAYSLLYDLCEWLAMELQENGVLSRYEPSRVG